jgi:hypothetical protein
MKISDPWSSGAHEVLPFYAISFFCVHRNKIANDIFQIITVSNSLAII